MKTAGLPPTVLCLTNVETMHLSHIKWLSLFALLVNAAAMFSPVINGGDSITYAALSQHIAQTNDWADLVLDGKDWLDKPHLPFWLTALSFKLFGIGAFAYILPGFLFHLLGGYFTYRIARLFYDREAAWLALLVYVSAYHLMDSSIEVKAETYLTGFIMGACYYWLRFDAQTRLKYLLLGALLSAGALMTKGVFTLITISSGLVCLWLYRGGWRKLWSGRWWLALALSVLFTAPELVALYLQFDSHPEKLVFGQTGVSGIRFFLWDSQFGRFFNSGPIRDTSGGGSPYYFVLVLLWAFLPWVAVFAAALASGVRTFFSVGAGERAGFVFLCASFFITFLLFSATRFQLDHYTVILFPFAAILCGQYLHGWLAQPARALPFVQAALAALLVLLALGLSVYAGNVAVLGMELALLFALCVYGYMQRQQWRAGAVLAWPVFGIVMLYAFLALANALTFTAHAAAWNAARQLAGKADAPVYVYRMDIVARELGLYHAAPTVMADEAAQLPAGAPYYLVVKGEQLPVLRERLGSYEQVGQGNWVVHKTGTLPRFLRLVRSEEPLEDVRIVRVTP